MVKNTYATEIERSYQISKEFSGGYSSYGDRSEYLIKFIKQLKTSEDIKAFKKACGEFIRSGDDDKIDFIVCVLIDGVKFGSIL